MKTTARLTGIGYLIIFITGFYGNFYVLEGLVEPGSEQATFHNIVDNPATFSKGVFAFVLMALIDLVLAWPLYTMLKETNRKLALASSLLRVFNAAFFFAALSGLFDIYAKMNAGGLTVFHTASSLVQFNLFWTIGLLIFGLHLLLLGKLIWDSSFFPKPLGLLIAIAGAGYVIDCTAQLSLSNYSNYKELFEAIVICGGVIGEFSFTIWLLVKGVRN